MIDLYWYFEQEGGEGHNSNASLQWDAINELLNSIFKIQIIGIENRDRNLYETCQREISVLLSLIAQNEFPNLKELQETYIVTNIIRDEVSNAEAASKLKLYDDLYMIYRLESYMLDSAIENNKLYVKYILPIIADFIIIAQRNGKLESFGLLHDWGNLSRLISKYYKENELSRKALKYIINTLEVLKKEIEENQLPKEAPNYDELKIIFKSLKDTLTKDNGESASDLINGISKIIKTFVEVPRTKDFRIVKWE